MPELPTKNILQTLFTGDTAASQKNVVVNYATAAVVKRIISLMNLSPEALYLLLGQLVAEMPDLQIAPITPDVNQWLGRAAALVSETGNIADSIAVNVAANNLTGVLRETNAQTIAAIVHRALAIAEMKAPAGAKGAFIAAGSSFDAFSAVGKVLARARGDILIVDPYADGKALTDFAVQASEGISIRILAGESEHKATLNPAAQNWAKQFAASRPLEVRLAPAKTLHDRLIILDEKEAWSLTQSLNAFATRSPATIVRVDEEIAAMKVAAYQPLWQSGKPL